MSKSSWLVGSEVIADQTVDLWAVPSGDLEFLVSPAIASSYPGSGTDVTNIAPSSGEVGSFNGNTSYSGGYFDFDGASGDIEWSTLTGGDDVFSGGGTAICWAKADSDGEASVGRLIAKGNGSSRGWGLFIRDESAGSARFAFLCRTSGTLHQWHTDSTASIIGNWVMVRVTWDSDTPATKPRIWINESEATVSVLGGAGSGTFSSDVGDPLRLGNRGGDNATFDGVLGVAALYGKELSTAEGATFYQATLGDHGGAGSMDTTAITYAYAGTYLYHATSGLSLMGQLDAAITAAGISNVNVYLSQDGYVSIDADAVFGIDWTAAGQQLRDALGFAGDLSPNVTHRATTRSHLLWVPRRVDSPEGSVFDSVGNKRYDEVTVTSRDGTMVSRTFGDPLRPNSYTWHYIDKAQFWENDEAGELFHFFGEVLSPRANFNLYRAVDADYTSASEVTLGTPLGPYAMTGGDRELPLRRSSGYERTDCKFDFTLEVLKVPEYTA